MGEKQIAPVLADVWPIWRDLVRQFSLFRFPLDFLFTPGSWRALGVDLLSGLRANRSTSAVAERMRQLSGRQVTAIVRLAELNVRRQEQMFRLLAIFYVSVPFSAAVLLFQASPQDARELLEASSNGVILLVSAALAAVAFYLAAAWRARQLLTAVTLAAIEAQAEAPAAPSDAEALEAA